MENEVADGVFLIYDMALDRPHQLIGSVMTADFFGGKWEYWSKDSDYGKGETKADVIAAMQARIALRAADCAAYEAGHRYRFVEPPPEYSANLAALKARGRNTPILEFNCYGGLYATA
jgi:hypothetical protein